MSENSAPLTAKLEQLVKQIMQESDTVKYDQLASEIWTVLDQLESLRTHTVRPKSPLYGQ